MAWPRKEGNSGPVFYVVNAWGVGPFQGWGLKVGPSIFLLFALMTSLWASVSFGRRLFHGDEISYPSLLLIKTGILAVTPVQTWHIFPKLSRLFSKHMTWAFFLLTEEQLHIKHLPLYFQGALHWTRTESFHRYVYGRVLANLSRCILQSVHSFFQWQIFSTFDDVLPLETCVTETLLNFLFRGFPTVVDYPTICL